MCDLCNRILTSRLLAISHSDQTAKSIMPDMISDHPGKEFYHYKCFYRKQKLDRPVSMDCIGLLEPLKECFHGFTWRDIKYLDESRDIIIGLVGKDPRLIILMHIFRARNFCHVINNFFFTLFKCHCGMPFYCRLDWRVRPFKNSALDGLERGDLP